MEPLIDIWIRDWLSKLDETFARTGEDFDISWWAVFMTYDIISEVGFGAPFGFVEKGVDTTFLKKYLVANPEDDSGIGVLMRFRDDLIEQRVQDLKTAKDIRRIDLLQTVLEARTENGEPLSMEYATAETLLVLLAGADTTGTIFQALIPYLLTHSAVDNNPQYHEILENLPYFVAYVRKTLLCGCAKHISSSASWDMAMMELFNGPLQFFYHYKPYQVKDTPEAKFMIKGGVGFWEDIWVRTEKRPLVRRV
ncbi:cytochrome P450 [Aspergillus crustosus]